MQLCAKDKLIFMMVEKKKLVRSWNETVKWKLVNTTIQPHMLPKVPSLGLSLYVFYH